MEMTQVAALLHKVDIAGVLLDEVDLAGVAVIADTAHPGPATASYIRDRKMLIPALLNAANHDQTTVL